RRAIRAPSVVARRPGMGPGLHRRLRGSRPWRVSPRRLTGRRRPWPHGSVACAAHAPAVHGCHGDDRPGLETAAGWRRVIGDVVLFRRLLSQARPYWPHVVALFLLSLLSSPLSLLTPLPLKIAVDSVIGSHPLPHVIAPFVPDAIARSPATLLAIAVGLLVTVALLRQLQGMTNTLLQAYVREKLVQSFRARLFRHVQRLSLAYHDARGTADSTQARAEERFIRRSTEGVKVRLRLASLEGSFNVLVGPATAAGMAAVLLIGVRHVGAGVLTLGELLMVMAYMNQLYEPLRTISRKAATLQLHLASAERAFALLDEPSDVEERPNARPLVRASGAIALRNISY